MNRPRTLRRSLDPRWALTVLLIAGASFGQARTVDQGPAAVASTPTPTRSPSVEVLVIRASPGDGGVGSGLDGLPQLTRPPFSAYGQLDLVSRTTVTVSATAANVTLPNGDSVALTLVSRLPNGRYQIAMRLTLGGRVNALEFSASPGAPFFTARSTGGDTALVLGFVVQ